MPKNLTEILSGGFSLWKNNLILGVPPLLNIIVEMGLWAIFLIIILIIALVMLGAGFGSGVLPGDVNHLKDVSGFIALIKSLGAFIIVAFVLFIVALLITLLVIAFFTAGLIGMSKEAIETGKTQFSTMISCGKKKFISMFFAYLIVSAIILIPAILAGIILLIIFMGAVEKLYLIFLIFAAIILWISYAVAVGIIFSVAKYALVISDTGAVGAVKSGFEFFMKHKADVILMWFVVFCLSLVFTGIYSVLYMAFSFIPVIGGVLALLLQMMFYAFTAIVIAPLTAVWWSMLYMEHK